jgi:hypothetical protein
MSAYVLGYALFVIVLLSVLAEADKDPDDGRDMIAITTNKGYPIEEYFVQTEDGYILGLFRIPYGRSESMNAINSGKPIVHLQHGLLDSSYTFVNNFPSQSLAFILADAGYDVWLGIYIQNNFFYCFSCFGLW